MEIYLLWAILTVAAAHFIFHVSRANIKQDLSDFATYVKGEFKKLRGGA